MRYITLLLTVLYTILPVSLRAELYLVDKIECVVCGPVQNTPLTETQVSWKRNLDGQVMPPQQQLQQEIINQQVVADKMPLDPTAADKYVESLKKQNNLTDTDLKDMFAQVGRTFAEGIELLSNQYMHEMFMHHKFKSYLIPTEDDIAQFYKDHPVMEDGWCDMQVAYVEFEADAKEQMKKSLDDTIAGTAQDPMKFEWSTSVKVFYRDIADDKLFIKNMKPGEVIIQEVNGSFELYKLIDKKEPYQKPVDECRSFITEQLNRQKFATMLENYNKEVRQFVDIINLSDYAIM